MKKISVLGTGCSKCKVLFSNAEQAIKESNLDCEIEKVEEITDILAYGVMSTPALVIDGKVVSSGKILSAKEIQDLI